MSILNKNYNPQEYPGPLLDLSPTFPSSPLNAAEDFAEDDFMSIELEKKYTTGNRAYPLRAINSESSNLMYLGYTTLTTYDSCLITGSSKIFLNYKLTKIRPVAFCFRMGTAIGRFPEYITIHGYRKIGENTMVSKIANIADLTANIYHSGVFYLNEEQQEFFDGLIISYGSDTVSDYNSPSIGTFKVLGYPQEWNPEIQEIYNSHALNLFDYAAATTNPNKGQIKYASLGEEGSITE